MVGGGAVVCSGAGAGGAVVPGAQQPRATAGPGGPGAGPGGPGAQQANSAKLVVAQANSTEDNDKNKAGDINMHFYFKICYN